SRIDRAVQEQLRACRAHALEQARVELGEWRAGQRRQTGRARDCRARTQTARRVPVLRQHRQAESAGECAELDGEGGEAAGATLKATSSSLGRRPEDPEFPGV